MKKFVVFVLLLILGMAPVARAQGSVEELVGSVSGADRLEELLPEGMEPEALPSQEDPNFLGGILSYLGERLFKGLFDGGGFFFGMTALILIAGILEQIKGTMEDPPNETLFQWVRSLSVAGYALSSLLPLIDSVGERVGELSDFMVSLLPITGALWVAGGSPTGASVQSGGLLLAVDLFSVLCHRVLLPLVYCLLALSIASALFPVVPGIHKTVKKAYVSATVFLMTLLLTLLSFQTELGKSADGLAARSVKFAFSSFVPIVGNLVGESARTVGAAVGYLKNTTGMLAVTGILWMALLPLAGLICAKASLWGSAIVARLCSCADLAVFLEELGEILSMVMATLLCVSVYFILSLTLFSRSGWQLALV